MTNPMVRRFVSLMAGHRFFAGLTPDELAELASFAATRVYQGDQTIFLKGDPADSLMAVLRGQVKVSSVSAELNVREVAFNVIGEGEIVGEIGLLDGHPRTANATALGITELLILPRPAFMSFLADHPPLAMDLIEVLCQRLRQTSDFVEDLRLRDVPKRLARRLLWLAHRAQDGAAGGNEVEVKIRQEDLAEFAGIARETTTKEIGKWREAGLLRTAKGSIHVRDMAKLQELAGDDPVDYPYDPSL